MAAKYITKADIDYYAPGYSAITVIDDPQAPIKTGILNADGVMLYRVTETVKLGFDITSNKKNDTR